MSLEEKWNWTKSSFNDIDVEKIEYPTTRWNTTKSIEGLSLKNFKKILSYIIKDKKDEYNMELFIADNTFTIDTYCGSEYGIFIFNDKYYIIKNFSNVLPKLTLLDYQTAKIPNGVLNSLCMTKRVDFTKNYDLAVQLVSEGKVDFINLFGKNRMTVKSGNDLHKMMQSESFLTDRNQPMCGRSYGEANIAAVFNYYPHLFNKDIYNYLMQFITDERSKEYQIVKRMRDKMKKEKIDKTKVPEEFLLFLEVVD